MSYPVHLYSVVTYYDPHLDTRRVTLFVNDSSGGIYVAMSSPPAIPFKAGDLVEIIGVSAAGDFAPIVSASEVRRHREVPFAFRRAGSQPDPDAVWRYDGQWVEVEGVVRAVSTMGRKHPVGAGFERRHRHRHHGERSGRRLRQSGRRQNKALAQCGPAIQSPAPDHWRPPVLSRTAPVVTIVEPAPAHPFALPVSPVSTLLRFTPASASHHRVHIQGTVTLAWPADYSACRTGCTVSVLRPTKPPPSARENGRM